MSGLIELYFRGKIAGVPYAFSAKGSEPHVDCIRDLAKKTFPELSDVEKGKIDFNFFHERKGKMEQFFVHIDENLEYCRTLMERDKNDDIFAMTVIDNFGENLFDNSDSIPF